MVPLRRPSRPFGVWAVRTGLPLLLVIAAIVVLIVGPRGLAPGLLMAAFFVFVADWIIRFAFSSQVDRDAEARARRRFSRSGRWPEDEPPGPVGGPADGDPHRSSPSRRDTPVAPARRSRRPPRR